jgi:PTH1 family peptidyl-tRNA hydrolase
MARSATAADEHELERGAPHPPLWTFVSFVVRFFSEGRTKLVKAIIGLGNPGLRYAQTRHNVGFRVVERLAEQLSWHWDSRHAQALLAGGTIDKERVVLAKPDTFMNNSGIAVSGLVRWFKLTPADLLIICDDLDLPLGRVRLRAQGSAGGHHGLESIIAHLHTQQFPRLRIGIGRPANPRMDTIDFVLGSTPQEERAVLAAAEERAAEAALTFVRAGIETAMNRYNTAPQPGGAP